MFISWTKIAPALSMSFNLVAASLTPVNNNIELRNVPGVSSENTLKLLYRSLASVVNERESAPAFKQSVTLDTGLDGLVLFQAAGYAKVHDQDSFGSH